jgi:hypothetical protein
MPSKVATPPVELLSLVHDFLSNAGLSKAAKKLESEVDKEVNKTQK